MMRIVQNRKDFVKWVGKNFSDEIKQDFNLGIEEIEAMKNLGHLPSGLTVGRRMPLKGCGDPEIFKKYDDWDNMVILSFAHQVMINRKIRAQTKGMVPGEQRLINMPVIPGYWAKPVPQDCKDQPDPSIIQAFEEAVRQKQSALGLAMMAADSFVQPNLVSNSAVRPVLGPEKLLRP
jgi:hypothetical protein